MGPLLSLRYVKLEHSIHPFYEIECQTSYETMCDALRLPCLKVAGESSIGGSSRKRTAQTSKLSNKRFRAIDQQPPQDPSKAANGVDDCLRAPMDEESAVQLLYQLQSQRGLAQSQTVSTDPIQQAQTTTGLQNTSENWQGSSRLDGSQVISDANKDPNFTLLYLGTEGLLQRAASEEIVNNSHRGPEGSLARSENYCTHTQNLSSQIANNRASANTREKHAMRWEGQVGQNESVVETNASETPELMLHQSPQDTLSQPVQFQLLSDETERTLQNGYDINADMDLFKGYNIDPDMDLFNGCNIDFDTDLSKEHSMNPGMDVSKECDVDLAADLLVNTQEQGGELLLILPVRTI